MTGKIELVKEGRIARAVQTAIRQACAVLPAITPIRHQVLVIMAPAPVVMSPRDEDLCGYGLFEVLDDLVCTIALGCAPPERSMAGEWPAVALETLCHEVAHYEQFRDGRPLQERGVAVRARSLVRQIKGASRYI